MTKPDGTLLLSLVRPDGTPLGGRADILLEHQEIDDRHVIRDADASKRLRITGLHRAPKGFYSLRIDPEDFAPVGQFINIRPSGDTEVEISFGTAITRPSQPRFTVFVADYASKVVDDATVTLHPLENQNLTDRNSIALRFDARSQEYGTREARPGAYRLEVRATGFENVEREVEVQPAGGKETVILGKKGMPSYQRGKVRVPFEPEPRLIACTLDSRVSDQDLARLDELTGALTLEPVDVPEAAWNEGVRLFTLPTSAGEDEQETTLGRLLELSFVLHAGAVIQVGEHSVSYLTAELIVRFAAHVTRDDAEQILGRLDLDVLRTVPYSANTFHVRWSRPGTYRLLDRAAELTAQDDIEWAEPNLVSTAELDAIVPTDFLWSGVWDRQLVGTPDAWQALQDDGLEAYGDPSLIIAAIDQGIQSTGGVPAHPDFQGTVSDGSDKVYQLYDFRTLVAHNDAPPGDHGMGVSGVAAAKAGNASIIVGQEEGLAGAAPNCRLMGLIYPVTEIDRADMYIWAAGFDPNSPRVGFPAPITPGADLFTTSIGFGAGAPISGLAANMLDYLTTFGRGGKGCACFFSAGNANNNFTNYRPWAAYEKTWGMAASTLDDDGTTEIRAPYSGFGPVELCAPSHDRYDADPPQVEHNPPDRYGTWSADLVGTGNLIGHVATETTLTAAVNAGDTTLPVVSSAGFSVGDRLLIELPGADGSETAVVTNVPSLTEIEVDALVNDHDNGDPVMTGAANYKNNFGGTSSATPLAAGVAALALSANPDLTWIELRHIMRESAIKIDPANNHPIGRWLDVNGDPSEMSGLPPAYSAWYGYGRVDAAGAVNAALAYPFSRDLMIRDNLADVGTVPVGSPFWTSPDIWVRNTDPAIEGAAALPAFDPS
ncbi:MAG: S8 family serine peptidase, partial [Acidobacteriota bacterium]